MLSFEVERQLLNQNQFLLISYNYKIFIICNKKNSCNSINKSEEKKIITFQVVQFNEDNIK